MSVIGPRPGLWNQDFLTAERDKYGANDIKRYFRKRWIRTELKQLQSELICYSKLLAEVAKVEDLSCFLED